MKTCVSSYFIRACIVTIPCRKVVLSPDVKRPSKLRSSLNWVLKSVSPYLLSLKRESTLPKEFV